MLLVVKLLILGFVIASGVLGGPFGGRGGVLFGMGRVIREEKLVVGGGRFLVKLGGCLRGFGCWHVSPLLWCSE